MVKTKIYILLLMSLFLMISCNDEADLTEGDHYFIFGQYFGECLGNCAAFFLLENGMLYTDEMDFFSSDPVFSNQTINEIPKIDIANSLKENIPSFLRNSNDGVFGCPDCGDWGGLYIEIKDENGVGKWQIDNLIENNPEELQAYAEQIQTAVEAMAN